MTTPLIPIIVLVLNAYGAAVLVYSCSSMESRTMKLGVILFFLFLVEFWYLLQDWLLSFLP